MELKELTLKQWSLNEGLVAASVITNLKRKGFLVKLSTIMTIELQEAYASRKNKKAQINGSKAVLKKSTPSASKPKENKVEVRSFPSGGIPSMVKSTEEFFIKPSQKSIEQLKSLENEIKANDDLINRLGKIQLEMNIQPVVKPVELNDNLTIKIFTNSIISVVMASVIIFADGIAAGFLAHLGFPKMENVEYVFGAVGIAVGYIAIKAIITYNGREGDAWAAGFFLVQLGLHLSAFDVYQKNMPLNIRIGLIIIAISIATASAGFAVSMRSVVK